MSRAQPQKQDDVRDLIRAIHRDRVAAKEREQRERWTRHVSLMVVALAVTTAIGSIHTGRFSSRVLLNQVQASDTWAYYQAKSIKQRIVEGEARSATGALAAQLAAEDERYRKEEAELKERAEGFERARDGFARHGAPLGLAITLLQAAVALASVCLLTRKKLLWAASGALGLLGVGWLVYGFWFV